MDDAEPGEGADGNGAAGGPAESRPTPFDPDHPLADHWVALLEDMRATAAVYREEGWSVLELHPTESTALTGPDDFGLAVTVPGAEFEELESWTGDGRFGEYEVYRAETGRVFLLVVARDEERRRVVCVPAHYGFESVSALAELADPGAGFHTHVRQPDGERVTFTHDDAGPFLPGGGTDPDTGAPESGTADGDSGGAADGDTAGNDIEPSGDDGSRCG